MLREVLVTSLLGIVLSQTLVLGVNNLLVNSNTTYTVAVDRSASVVTLPGDGSITFDFPTASYSASQLTGVTCVPPCTVSGTTLKFNSSSFIGSPKSLSITVAGIANPPSTATPGDYTYKLLSSAAATLESAATRIAGFSAGQFKACSITFSPNTLRTVGTATLQLTPGNPIVVGGSLMLSVPTRWSSTVNQDRVVNASAVLSCSSNLTALSNSPTCTVDSTGNTITVSQFASRTSASFWLNLSPVLSPVVMLSQSVISIASVDSAGNTIDDYTVCTVAPPGPSILTLSSTTSILVAAKSAPTLSFSTTDLIATGDVLKVTFLSTLIQPNNFSSSSITVNDSSSGMVGLTTVVNLSTPNTDVSGRSYGYILPRLTGRTSVSNGSLFQLANLFIDGPPNTQTFLAFNLSIYRSGSLFCTGTISLSASANILLKQNVTADNGLVNAQTIYTLTFTTSSPLTSQGRLKVVIPSDILAVNYVAKSCSSAFVNNFTSNATCTLTSNVLTVAGLFYDTTPANSNVSLRFDGLTNPSTTKPTSAFTLTTYYDATNNKTDESQTLTFAAMPDTISNCNVTRNNNTVGAPSTYSFAYVVKNSLPKSAYIVIGLPAEVTLPSGSLTTSINGTVVLSTPVNTSGVQYVNITSPFVDIIPSATVLTIAINNLTNPGSTSPTSSFSLSSYNAGFIIENIISGLALGASSPNSFAIATITPSNRMNGQAATYLLSLQTSISYAAGTVLVLAIPSQVTVSSPGCTSLLLNATCSLVGGSLQITVTSALDRTLQYSINMTGFTNPRTFATSNAFTLTSYLSGKTARIDTSSISGITNNVANTINSLSLTISSPSQSYMVSNQTLQFTVGTTNYLTSTDYLELTYPAGYTFVGSGNSSVCTDISYNCIPTSGNSLKLKITSTSFSQQTSFTFSVFNYQSPNTTTSAQFQVNSFESAGTPIDNFDPSNAKSNVSFTVSCQMPCQTCRSTNQSWCLSCYKDTTITSEINFQSGSGQCVSQCGSGFYPEGNLSVCTACQSPCATCKNSTQCYSCVNSSSNSLKSFDPVTAACVATCSFGYFSNTTSSGYVCAVCSTSCLTCLNLATNCTGCNTGLVLYNNTCLTKCLDGYYADPIGVCRSCNPSCFTCVDSSNVCLTCNTVGYSRLYASGPCVSSCGDKNVTKNGQCLCEGTCATCAITTTNCTGCSSASMSSNYYFNSTAKLGECLQTCPDGTYSLNSQCVVCSTGCTQCTNSLLCLRCTGAYSLLNGQCLSSCPAGSYNFSNQCLNCSSSCATCNVTSNNCTSCSNPLGLLNSVCVTNCSNIPSMVAVATPSNGLVCQNCSSSCQTCSTIPSNCTACTANLSRYGTQCLATCPDTTYPSNNTCVNCVSPCSTCQNNNTCLSCIFNSSTANSVYYTVRASGTSVVRCIQNCTTLSLFVNGSECISCQSPCKSCNATAIDCLECQPGYLLQKSSCVQNCSAYYYLYNGQCLTACPENMTSYNGVCGAIPVPEPPVVIPEKTAPVPFTIATLVIVACVAVSYKITNGSTNLPAMAVALLSLLETLSWLVVAILVGIALPSGERLLKAGTWIIAGGLIFHLLNNILAIYFCVRYFANDYEFSKWLKKQSKCSGAGIIITCLLNHKFFNIFFSKAFGFTVFSATLSHNSLFTPMNIVAGLAFVPEVLVVVGCALSAADSTTKNTSQLYLSAIDAVVLTVLTVVFSIWSFKRPVQQEDNQHSLARRYEVREDVGTNNHTVEAMNSHEANEELTAELGKAPTYVARSAKHEPSANRKLIKPGHRAGSDYSKHLEGGIQILTKMRQTEQQIHFSETSSQFVSENSEATEGRAGGEEVATNLIKVKPMNPSKHRIPHDDGNADEVRAGQQGQQDKQSDKQSDSIVHKLICSEPSETENQGMAVHPDDEPDKPNLGKITRQKVELIDNENIDFEGDSNIEGEVITQHNKTQGNCLVDRRLDLQIEDITDDVQEEMPRVPSFQASLPREQKLPLRRQRVSSNVELKGKKQRPIDTSTMVLNASVEPEAVPSKPRIIGKNHSDVDLENTRSYYREEPANIVEDSYGHDMDVSPSYFNIHNQRYEPEENTNGPISNIQARRKIVRSEIQFRAEGEPKRGVQQSIVANELQQILPPENLQPLPLELLNQPPLYLPERQSRRGKAENQLNSSKVRSLERIYLNKLDVKKPRQANENTDRRNKLDDDR